VPNAGRVTLRMLGHSISGYPDWIQGNPAFVDLLSANPFRLWTDQELLAHAFAQPLICAPGACFHYAHTRLPGPSNALPCASSCTKSMRSAP
jgi:CubicO group peptidase (beta-lactamase class C family)